MFTSRLIRLIVIVSFLSGFNSALSQNRTGFSGNCGFNRVGVYFGGGVDFDLNQHQVHAGIKFYGPDVVFESNVVGLDLNYNYAFHSGNWFFGPSLSSSFFHEFKSTSELYLSEFLIRSVFGYEFGERVSAYSSFGLGAILNQSHNFVSGIDSFNSYINYEFSLGIKYYWRVPSDN